MRWAGGGVSGARRRGRRAARRGGGQRAGQLVSERGETSRTGGITASGGSLRAAPVCGGSPCFAGFPFFLLDRTVATSSTRRAAAGRATWSRTDPSRKQLGKGGFNTIACRAARKAQPAGYGCWLAPLTICCFWWKAKLEASKLLDQLNDRDLLRWNYELIKRGLVGGTDSQA